MRNISNQPRKAVTYAYDGLNKTNPTGKPQNNQAKNFGFTLTRQQPRDNQNQAPKMPTNQPSGFQKNLMDILNSAPKDSPENAQKMLTSRLGSCNHLKQLKFIIALAQQQFTFNSAHTSCLIQGFIDEAPNKIPLLLEMLEKIELPLAMSAYTKLFSYYAFKIKNLELLKEVIQKLIRSPIIIDEVFKQNLATKLELLLEKKIIQLAEYQELTNGMAKLRCEKFNKNQQALHSSSIAEEKISLVVALLDWLSISQTIEKLSAGDSMQVIKEHREESLKNQPSFAARVSSNAVMVQLPYALEQDLLFVLKRTKQSLHIGQKILTSLLTRYSCSNQLAIMIHLATNKFQFNSAHTSCLIEGFCKKALNKLPELLNVIRELKLPISLSTYARLIEAFTTKLNDQNGFKKVVKDLLKFEITLTEEEQHQALYKLASFILAELRNFGSGNTNDLHSASEEMRIKTLNEDTIPWEGYAAPQKLIEKFSNLFYQLTANQRYFNLPLELELIPSAVDSELSYDN